MQRRILVVDDSSTMRIIIRRALEGAGYVVDEARSGDDALDRYPNSHYDLITLDVDMPGMNGFEVCTRLRRYESLNAKASTPVVFLTSHDTLVDRQKGFSVGAADFISKPVDTSELLARINRLLGSETRLLGLSALVVEDSRATRNIICSCLRQSGVRVCEAEDGLKAYEILQSKGEELDLLITDYDMPGMDGKELCRKVRTELGRPWMPIIFLSGLSEMSYVLDMFAAGATDYITKPFTKEELVARLSVHVEIRRLNQERQRQIQELERLNLLKDSLLAVASHDLRAPLTGMLGYATLLEMSSSIDPEQREYVEGIKQSGEYLLNLINDVLDLAKLESRTQDLHLARCDLNQVALDSLRSLVHMAAPKNVVIRHSRKDAAKETPLYVDGDRNSLLRLVNNLLSNAIKFTPSGGRVDLCCCTGADGMSRLSVSDTGIGIPQAKIETLFKPFTGASRSGTSGEAGTGLGLSIVRQLADLHGAKINLTSEEGKGTTVEVVFPPIVRSIPA